MKQIVPALPAPEPEIEPAGPEIEYAALTPELITALVQELAIGLRDVKDILRTYLISPQDYENLKAQEAFIGRVDSARLEWQSATNTPARLAVEAAFTAELALPQLYARVVQGKDPLNHAVDFVKWLTDIGGLRRDAQKGPSQQQFKIEINLGADTQFKFEGGQPALDMLPAPAIDDSDDRI